MMSQELAEAAPSSTKMLRFFNYTIAVQQLSLHLHQLEIEYKSISAQAEIPEHLTTRNRMPSIQQDPQPVDLSNNGKKRIVFIDQRKVIEDLKQNIKMLETAISQLKAGSGADNPVVVEPSDSISFSADSSNTPTQTNDLSSEDERLQLAIKSSNTKPEAKIEFIEIMQESNVVVVSKNGDNHRRIDIVCSGFFHDRGQTLIAMLKAGSNLDYKYMPSSAIIGCVVEDFNLTPAITCRLWLMSEQTSWEGLPLGRRANIHILLFNINDYTDSLRSYDIGKQRVKIPNNYSIYPLCLIGIYNENNLNKTALHFFKQFQAEESIEHSLICEFSAKGKQQLNQFILSLISKFDLVNENKISQSGNNTVAEEDNVESNKSTCILQ